MALLLAHGAVAQKNTVFTTTAVNLIAPIGSLSETTQGGLGTSFSIDYRVKPSFLLVGRWDSSKLPVQSVALLEKLDPSLRGLVNEVKGKYVSNALGLYGVYYLTTGRVKPYLTAGPGFNIITVPTPFYNRQSRQLSLESTTKITLYGLAGAGLDWQFSKSVSAFGDVNIYLVPGSSLVAAGGNSYLTGKLGIRLPLF